MKLAVRSLSHTFHNGTLPPVPALQNISFTVVQGEIVSIVGPSGCGKTTLLECVAGLLTPDEGEVLLDGRPVTGACGHAAYMTQADVLLPWRNTRDNTALPLEIAGVKKTAARNEGMRLLQHFYLDPFAAHPPAALSGGMRQRVSLLRAYAAQKNILLLDEPFAKLDALTRHEIQCWFAASWEERKPAVVFVTHDVEEALLLADRVIVLSPRPARIINEVPVPLLRPRTRMLIDAPAFTALKQEIHINLGIP